jgi:hypothetical protein
VKDFFISEDLRPLFNEFEKIHNDKFPLIVPSFIDGKKTYIVNISMGIASLLFILYLTGNFYAWPIYLQLIILFFSILGFFTAYSIGIVTPYFCKKSKCNKKNSEIKPSEYEEKIYSIAISYKSYLETKFDKNDVPKEIQQSIIRKFNKQISLYHNYLAESNKYNVFGNTWQEKFSVAGIIITILTSSIVNANTYTVASVIVFTILSLTVCLTWLKERSPSSKIILLKSILDKMNNGNLD